MHGDKLYEMQDDEYVEQMVEKDQERFMAGDCGLVGLIWDGGGEGT